MVGMKLCEEDRERVELQNRLNQAHWDRMDMKERIIEMKGCVAKYSYSEGRGCVHCPDSYGCPARAY